MKKEYLFENVQFTFLDKKEFDIILKALEELDGADGANAVLDKYGQKYYVDIRRSLGKKENDYYLAHGNETTDFFTNIAERQKNIRRIQDKKEKKSYREIFK